jgi:hypothetical protein
LHSRRANPCSYLRWLRGAIGAGAWGACALHVAAVEPHPLLLRRDRCGEREQAWHPEAGIEVKLVTPAELTDLILSGEFVLLLHIGALLLASLGGFIDLEMVKAAR